jgi:FdhD protein
MAQTLKFDDEEMACTSQQTVTRWRDEQWSSAPDQLAVEVPVALEFNGISHAVMLATPSDLESFALGFALSEGIIPRPSDFRSAEIEESAQGVTVHCQISSQAFMHLKQRRRNMTGRTGCGLCGVESLDQVIRKIPVVAPGKVISSFALRAALNELSKRQPLGNLTGGMHAAAWSSSTGQLQIVCEDVGRHNALDKLIGRMTERKMNFQDGFLLITSRASVEMVQKAATLGISCLVAISAPTALAVETANSTGMTLIAFARENSFVLYTHTEKIDTRSFYGHE